MKKSQRVLSLLLCLVVMLSMISAPSVAHADWDGLGLYTQECVDKWLGTKPFGGWNLIDAADALFSSNYASSKPQKYYTTPTSSVQDKYGNVTNYYRGGDTTTTNIIDSYNKTFNTNNYTANYKLSNFLNQYTTNNNNYTYSADFKSWYYDNTTNNYNYSQNNLYYNEDNSRYYLTIDNSTDEYYMVDIQYSPTFVTVNYTYNNTVNNNETVGDVTNIYYYELKDGRNSSSLTAAEVAGMDFGYDVKNYELVTDDPNTLSLQHFDGDYTDSSSYNRSFYSENRSTQYVDSGAFGQAVRLSSGSAAGVTIPGLSGYSSLSFDFRVYYADISNLGIYFGDTNIFQRIPASKSVSFTEYYTDDGNSFNIGEFFTSCSHPGLCSSTPSYPAYGSTVDLVGLGYSYSNNIRNPHTPPTASDSGWSITYSSKYGWYQWGGSVPSPVINLYRSGSSAGLVPNSYRYVPIEQITSSVWHNHQYTQVTATVHNSRSVRYTASDVTSVPADFSYSSYKSQWVSMRITLSGGNIYYFVNGDLVGVGAFTKPTADKFYIKSSGTVYLDELRVTTGSLSSTTAYTPSSSPYDTNKVLALPDELVANTIYVQHTTPVKNHRIGGVRPSNPETGFFYVPLYDDYTGAQPQLYDGSNWVNVNAVVYDGKNIKDVKGFKFSPVGSSPDVDVDAKPGRPTKPGEDVDQDTCEHDWVENVEEYVSPTCTIVGTKSYTCSKCEKSKKETIPLLDHDWKVKVTMPNQYDNDGNQISLGFTVFECLRCGEQYKSTDGTAPPALDIGNINVTPGGGGSDDSGEEKEGFLSWLLGKVGEVFGAIGEGVLSLLKAAVGKVLDGIIDLINMVFEKLSAFCPLTCL